MATEETTPDTRDVVAETPSAPQTGTKTHVKSKGPRATGTPTVSLAAIAALKDDAHHGKGIYYSGSFVPDTRFYVLAICTFIGRLFSATDYESSQFVTPPALIAYYLYCLYFLLFYRDMHSKNPSRYAREFTDFGRYNQLLKIMESVYIPDEIFSILQNFSEWSPELLPNFQFVPTLSSTLMLYDLPYLMHPLIFLNGHNTLFNRADSVGHYSNFLKAPIFNMTSTSPTIAARVIRVANLIGCAYNNASNNIVLVQNWLSRVILPFVDPATHRQHLRRTGIAKFNLETIDSRPSTWNPYRFLFTTESAANFESFLDCVHASSEFNRDQLKATKKMSDLFRSVPPAPGSYMIMSYSTPTWHLADLDATHFPAGELTPGSFTTLHNEHTRFGVQITSPTTNANNITVPTTDDGSGPATGFIENLYLASKHTGPAHNSASMGFDIIQRNEMKHSMPNMLVFSPGDSTVDAAIHPMVSGLIVHNGNIDSTAVRTPNPDDEIPYILSRYYDGFMSLRVIRPRFALRTTWLIARTAMESVSNATLGLLWRSDRFQVSRIDADHNAPAAGGFMRMFPFYFVSNVTNWIFGNNMLSSNTVNEPTDPAHRQIADAWSSFRITDEPNALPTVKNTAFGINHGEVLFGRNSTITKFSHPADLLRRN
nr:capsid protein [Heterobasidion partitivirus 7]